MYGKCLAYHDVQYPRSCQHTMRLEIPQRTNTRVDGNVCWMLKAYEHSCD